MSGRVIAAVNRKGGVGKTTLVIALADTIVSEFKSSVIVVDADPQASASIALIGPDQTLLRSQAKKSLASAIGATASGRTINVEDFVVQQVNRIRGRADIPLSLVSNGEELWDLEYELGSTEGVPSAKSAMSALLTALKQQYEYVLVDCPPGQTHTSSAALAMADLIISPTVPDRLSKLCLEGLQRACKQPSHGGGTRKAFLWRTRYRAKLKEHQEYFGQFQGRDRRPNSACSPRGERWNS
ncbi:MAG: ParA family protein [Caulobacteraceae bacterium]|nr:ParA family protein [Caulobacteraceae bacterium]